MERSGRELLDAMRTASTPDAPVEERLEAGILAFLAYVDEHRSGWAVLHKEATTQGGPLAAEVAGLRARIAGMLAAVFHDEAFAQAFVGAGESLANWWLDHPEEPREQVARLLMQVAQVALPLPHEASSLKP